MLQVRSGDDGQPRAVMGYRFGDIGVISIHPSDKAYVIIHLPTGMSLADMYGIFLTKEKAFEGAQKLVSMTNTWDVTHQKLRNLLIRANKELKAMGGIRFTPKNIKQAIPEGTLNERLDDI